MKKILQVALVSVLTLVLTQSLHAVPITGNIGFTGGVTFDTSTASTATQVTSWITPVAKLVSGAFASITPGSAATFSSTVWNFNTITPITSFWSVGGFTFDLLASSIVRQGGSPNGVGGFGYVVVNGTGTVSGNGYDATPMVWAFSTQDPRARTGPDQWTFSASAQATAVPPSVPDSGTTVTLLGLGLLSTGFMKRKFAV